MILVGTSFLKDEIMGRSVGETGVRKTHAHPYEFEMRGEAVRWSKGVCR